MSRLYHRCHLFTTGVTSLYLLFQVLQKPTSDKKQGLVAASRKVADCLGALVKSAEALKGKNEERMLVVLVFDGYFCLSCGCCIHD